MSLPPLNQVIIVGGSLAGLMHALVILTHSPSTQVTILERADSALLHNQGAGVVAGSETQRLFTRYVHPGREIAVTSQQRLYLDRNGGIVEGSVEDRQQRMTSWDVLYRLLRWRVDGMKADGYLKTSDVHISGPPSKASYLYGCTLTSIKDLGPTQGVEVTWTNKSSARQTATADLVLAADGASSSIRHQLLPDVKRTYVGYVAFRGTVPEIQLTSAATAVVVEKFAFFHTTGHQILGYTIPGDNGTLEHGKRLVNWVWYCNYEDGSAALDELMTDGHGRRHKITLPVGGMQEGVWKQQIAAAARVLPPQFAELVAKTGQPFVQAITDVAAEENMLLEGRVLLVGDALAGFRPHTAASTSQAAFDALALGEWMTGKIDGLEYQERCLRHAREMQRHGVELGERSQFGRHPLAG